MTQPQTRTWTILLLTLVAACSSNGAGKETPLKDGAREVGSAAGSAVRQVGKGAKKAGKAVGEAAKEGGRAFKDAVRGE